MRRLLALPFFLLAGCGGEPVAVPAAATGKFITPAERSRMSVEDKDDPYTLMRLQEKPKRGR